MIRGNVREIKGIKQTFVSFLLFLKHTPLFSTIFQYDFSFYIANKHVLLHFMFSFYFLNKQNAFSFYFLNKQVSCRWVFSFYILNKRIEEWCEFSFYFLNTWWYGEKKNPAVVGRRIVEVLWLGCWVKCTATIPGTRLFGKLRMGRTVAPYFNINYNTYHTRPGRKDSWWTSFQSTLLLRYSNC